MWTDECSQKIESEFKFLQEKYDFHVYLKERTNEGFSLHYKSSKRRVCLLYDFREDFLYFEVMADDIYGDEFCEDSVAIFSTIFKFYEPSIDLKKLQPQNRQCTEPIELNAKLLAKYGDKVLKAEEWIFWDINLHQPARAQLLR